jgi:hypothetical protein
VTLRPELAAVYEGLFRSNGPELTFRRPNDYGAAIDTPYSVLADTIAATGDVLLGFRDPGHPATARVHLNPARNARVPEGGTLVMIARE